MDELERSVVIQKKTASQPVFQMIMILMSSLESSSEGETLMSYGGRQAVPAGCADKGCYPYCARIFGRHCSSGQCSQLDHNEKQHVILNIYTFKAPFLPDKTRDLKPRVNWK